MKTRGRPARNTGVGVLLVMLAGLAGCAGGSPTQQPTKSRSGADKTPSSGGGTVPKEPKGPVEPGLEVTRVIDGDTVEVRDGARVLTVRLIGIDTPETVHPSEPIECYGPEATSFAVDELVGREVTLEYDPSQGRRDYYGRTLAYLWVETAPMTLFNRAAVRKGYALEYTFDSAYAWQSTFMRAEQAARQQRRGVWACPRPGS